MKAVNSKYAISFQFRGGPPPPPTPPSISEGFLSFHSLMDREGWGKTPQNFYLLQTHSFRSPPPKFTGSRGELGFVWSQQCPVFVTFLTGFPGPLAPASLPGPFRNALELVIAFVGALSCTADWNFPTSQRAGR